MLISNLMKDDSVTYRVGCFLMIIFMMKARVPTVRNILYMFTITGIMDTPHTYLHIYVTYLCKHPGSEHKDHEEKRHRTEVS